MEQHFKTTLYEESEQKVKINFDLVFIKSKKYARTIMRMVSALASEEALCSGEEEDASTKRNRTNAFILIATTSSGTAGLIAFSIVS